MWLGVAGLGILLAAAAGLRLTTPAQGAPVTYQNAALGFQVDLPTNFRHSTLRSYVSAPTDAFYVGTDVLTPHSETAEANDQSRTIGPTLRWIVAVEVVRNPQNLTPLQFLNTMEWARDQTTQDVTFAGSPATLLRNGARFPVTYYVSHGGNMYLISYRTDNSPIAGATANDLSTIVASFKFTR
jgi:hypothetical protein